MLKFCNILCSQIQYLETGLLFNGLNPKPYAQAKCKLCYFETFISVHFQWRSLASNSCVNPHFIFVPLPSNIFVRYHRYHSSINSILLYLFPNSILYFIHSFKVVPKSVISVDASETFKIENGGGSIREEGKSSTQFNC
jgi:hypothetical protein